MHLSFETIIHHAMLLAFNLQSNRNFVPFVNASCARLALALHIILVPIILLAAKNPRSNIATHQHLISFMFVRSSRTFIQSIVSGCQYCRSSIIRADIVSTGLQMDLVPLLTEIRSSFPRG